MQDRVKSILTDLREKFSDINTIESYQAKISISADVNELKNAYLFLAFNAVYFNHDLFEGLSYFSEYQKLTPSAAEEINFYLEIACNAAWFKFENKKILALCLYNLGKDCADLLVAIPWLLKAYVWQKECLGIHDFAFADTKIALANKLNENFAFAWDNFDRRQKNDTGLIIHFVMAEMEFFSRQHTNKDFLMLCYKLATYMLHITNEHSSAITYLNFIELYGENTLKIWAQAQKAFYFVKQFETYAQQILLCVNPEVKNSLLFYVNYCQTEAEKIFNQLITLYLPILDNDTGFDASEDSANEVYEFSRIIAFVYYMDVVLAYNNIFLFPDTTVKALHAAIATQNFFEDYGLEDDGEQYLLLLRYLAELYAKIGDRDKAEENFSLIYEYYNRKKEENFYSYNEIAFLKSRGDFYCYYKEYTQGLEDYLLTARFAEEMHPHNDFSRGLIAKVREFRLYLGLGESPAASTVSNVSTASSELCDLSLNSSHISTSFKNDPQPKSLSAVHTRYNLFQRLQIATEATTPYGTVRLRSRTQ